MPDQTVQISLEVVQRGLENIQQLSNDLKQAEGATQGYTQKVNGATEANEKHKDSLLKARSAIKDFHREMYLFTFTAAAVTGLLVGLGRSSDALHGQLDKAGSAIGNISKQIGDMVAQSGLIDKFSGAMETAGKALSNFSQNFKVSQSLFSMGAFQFNPITGFTPILAKKTDADRAKDAAALKPSADTFNMMDTYRAKTMALNGDKEGAQALEMQLEFLTKIQPQMDKLTGTVRQDLFNAWKQYETASAEALKRSELGLKTNIEIAKDLKRGIADAYAGGVSNIAFNFMEGKKQSPMEMLKEFTTPIHRAIADAIGQSFKTAVFGGEGFGSFFQNIMSNLKGENSTTRTMRDGTRQVTDHLKTSNAILQSARECICRTAENTGSMIGALSARSSMSGTIEIPGSSSKGGGFLGALGGLAGAVSGIGGIFNAGKSIIGGIGNFISGGSANATQYQSQVTNIIGGGTKLNYTGGEVMPSWRIPHFATGGEMPAMVQPGEFVVRKSIAQNNKDFLKDFNIDGRQSKRGGQNVFIIKANDAASFADQLSTPSGRQQIELQVIRAIMGNGNARKVIKDFAK